MPMPQGCLSGRARAAAVQAGMVKTKLRILLVGLAAVVVMAAGRARGEAAAPGDPAPRRRRAPGQLVAAIAAAGEKYGRDRCPQHAAAVSYHVLFSLVPLFIFVASALGVVLRDDAADLVLLCVPDRAIAQVAAAIAPGATSVISAPRLGDESALYEQLDSQYRLFEQVDRTFGLVSRAVSPSSTASGRLCARGGAPSGPRPAGPPALPGRSVARYRCSPR